MNKTGRFITITLLLNVVFINYAEGRNSREEGPGTIIIDTIQNEDIQSRTFGLDLFLNKNFLMYVPEEYEENGKDMPLLLLLHGMGKRGTDINDVLTMTLFQNVINGKDYPFLIMAPQCYKSDSVTNKRFTKDSNPKDVITYLNEVISRYKVDVNRIYISGTSGGGTATYHFLGLHPDKFAAAIPVCGNTSPYLKDSVLLANIPMWIFHGEDDTSIDVENSINMYNAIKNAGGEDVFLTTYPGVGHASWDLAYNENELFPWMLSHSLATQDTLTGIDLISPGNIDLPYTIRKNNIHICKQPNILAVYSLSGKVICREQNVSFKSLEFHDRIVIIKIVTGGKAFTIKHIRV